MFIVEPEQVNTAWVNLLLVATCLWTSLHVEILLKYFGNINFWATFDSLNANLISLCDDPKQVIVNVNFLPQRFMYSVLAWFSVPLLSRVCPNDSYKIYKSGECFSRDVNCTYIFNRSVIHCWREFFCPWLIINTERSQNWRMKRWGWTIFVYFLLFVIL